MSSSPEPKACDEYGDTEQEIRVLVSDSTEKTKLVVPLDGMNHHYENNIFECNTRTHSVSKKKNEKSTTGRAKLRASIHAIMRSRPGLVVNRGANGAILGNDGNSVFRRKKMVSAKGIDNHELSSLPTVNAAAKTVTNGGPAMLVLRNCAYHGVNRTLHSSGQIEHHDNKVSDNSIKAGGR